MCARDPSEMISQRLKDMFDLFTQHYEDRGAENRGMGKGTQPQEQKIYCDRCVSLHLPENSFLSDMAVKYFHLAEALYYRILESIIEREKMILGDADLSVSVKHSVVLLSVHLYLDSDALCATTVDVK